ncbi:hypothetical protein [Bifidobacterium longum]|uniref:Uncharacterized protein n=2 Tax=Bifidobacterium longum TaxID=216816 RepID=A0A9Q8QVH0_BIFLL|nr:hypothetical protein [Bifidobacterium longum]UNL65112.1 hypothetical protein G8B15_03720 [Bifidobacterium longum subsp. longum]UNL66762.1 hypothetical protein G8B14_01620 [Bifidobacterium longum subsp. longum]UNL68906.1 hypothetical protein G8B13_02420 [Bifidobacterium longum subsp. longum]UNL72192.1 hypothetical protein G8B12_10215 [Bifidobacterium longum subsp. longum]UNL81404.1 hypothetical protein G8B11_03055 [Bifidobacterium longum subsp. longum]
MTTNKRERNLVDEVAAKAINRIIERAGMNNSAVDRVSKSSIGYNRVRDIRNGLKAPVRLSEFLIVCDVCGADPVQTVRDIISEAKRIEEEQKRERRVEETKRILADNPMELAAYTDPDKEKYIEYGNGDDPA